ncbi:MAG: hypothetical protein KAW92_04090 [Candidatus Cloacimonetes bacterium]|nr:hypothetical protein [Candidatus Cloacimonadota bacterium]
MNILIYNLNGLTSKIINTLSKLKDISIYFAITEKDALRITAEIKPEMAIVGNEQMVKDKFVMKLSQRYPYLNIYRLEENRDNSADLNLIHQRTQEYVKFRTLINNNLLN